MFVCLRRRWCTHTASHWLCTVCTLCEYLVTNWKRHEKSFEQSMAIFGTTSRWAFTLELRSCESCVWTTNMYASAFSDVLLIMAHVKSRPVELRFPISFTYATTICACACSFAGTYANTCAPRSTLQRSHLGVLSQGDIQTVCIPLNAYLMSIHMQLLCIWTANFLMVTCGRGTVWPLLLTVIVVLFVRVTSILGTWPTVRYCGECGNGYIRSVCKRTIYAQSADETSRFYAYVLVSNGCPKWIRNQKSHVCVGSNVVWVFKQIIKRTSNTCNITWYCYLYRSRNDKACACVCWCSDLKNKFYQTRRSVGILYLSWKCMTCCKSCICLPYITARPFWHYWLPSNNYPSA